MRRGSRDGNHASVCAVFEALGCTVADLALSGVADFPDVIVGCVGVNHLVEIKNRATAYGRAGLNAGQSAFARDWRGGPVWLCHDGAEAAALVTRWRKETGARRRPPNRTEADTPAALHGTREG